MKTDLVKLFRMRVKRQRGERGRATGRVCWGAVTVSNRGMWWVSSYLELMRTVVVWKDVCGNGNAVCVSFRGRAGRGGFSLWMTMQSVISSLRWWGDNPPPPHHHHPICQYFFLQPWSLSVHVLSSVCLSPRIRSHSDLFHWGTFRRSTNVSSSPGKSNTNQSQSPPPNKQYVNMLNVQGG